MMVNVHKFDCRELDCRPDSATDGDVSGVGQFGNTVQDRRHQVSVGDSPGLIVGKKCAR